MRIYRRAAALAALSLIATTAHAGAAHCKSGFADDTRVRTEWRGDMAIAELRIGDRVWSFSEVVGRPGWSRITHRDDAGGAHYTLLSEFSEPDAPDVVDQVCWRIRRGG
jgi:hypothetical protein